MHTLRNTLAAVLAAAVLLPLAAHADPCKVEISGNDLMQYDKQQLAVPATCKEITVTLHHSGKQPREAMGHNWVLVNAADYTAVANAGLSAGLASDYVAPGDKRVIAHTRVVGGGETTSVTFPATRLKKGGDYKYLCTFPGHNALMHGTFKFG
ncbi:MAG TPA: azurin [Steroidobacteraceae bacterium]|nr:azurin [Steroidobacteraceae bacterium]